jgi:2-polyprenyl-6-hydroxyphenyl methylase/3-demethylubiquinone-9 3-methyltransferase
MKMKSNVDVDEIAKFSHLAADWWNKDGPLKTLHDINSARLLFINQSSSLQGKRILDVGCGGGILTEAMAAQGAKVTGLDMSIEALGVARTHALANHLSIEYVCSTIEDFDAEPFDVITCMEMLEHVPKPENIITHCARLLKSNGYLYLSTINRTFKAYAGVIVAAEYLLGLLPRQTHDFKKFIKPSELAQMVRAARLDLTSISGMAYNPLSRNAWLKDTVNTNYLVSCFKP